MKTVKVYDVGDKIMIKGTVHDVKVENGVHKYQFKDKKSSDVFSTWYTGDEVLEWNEDEKETDE